MTRLLSAALTAIGLIALAACGKADDPAAPPSRQVQAIVDMCVADGEDRAVCACMARALEAGLDRETLAALVDFAQALAQAQGKDARGMIAMGALANPKLVLALETADQSSKTCQQAAALEKAKLEVADAEAAQQARQKSAASRRCPHVPAVGPALPGAPVDDVAGLRPGMSFEDVEAVLECSGEVGHFDVKASWARNNQGLATRQLLRAADGEVCPAELRIPGGKGCEDGGYGFAPLQGVTQEFIVAFAGMPGAERAGVIWRRTVFPEGRYPTISAVGEALAAKYGAPHLQTAQEGYYSLGQRRGTHVHSWLHDPAGRPIARGDSARRARCVNGPRPTIQNRMSWNGSCGLTVRAEIVPTPGNAILARELNVVVMDQKRFDDAVRRFEGEIKAAVEAQARDTGVKPTL